MHRLFYLLVALVGSATMSDARSQPAGQRFVAIAFHDVVDKRDQLETDSVTSTSLAQFFDWLKGTGWTAISLDDVAAAARGVRRLPDKAILISFDDGYASLYTRVFPLLQVYRFPIVAALVGSWMEGRPGWNRGLRRSHRSAVEFHLVGAGARIAGVGPRRIRLAQLQPASRRAREPAGQHGAGGHHLAVRPGDRRLRGRCAVPRPHSCRPGACPQPAGGQSRTPAAGPGVAVRPLQRPRPRGRQAGRIHLCADARARARLYLGSFRHPPLFSLPESQLERPRAQFALRARPTGDAAHCLPHARRVGCGRTGRGARRGARPYCRGSAHARQQHRGDRRPCRTAVARCAARRRVFPQSASAHAARSVVAGDLADQDTGRQRRLPAPAARGRCGGGGRGGRADAVQRHDPACRSGWSGDRCAGTVQDRPHRGRSAGRHPRPAQPARSRLVRRPNPASADGLPCIGSNRPAPAAYASHERVRRPA